MWDQDPEKLLNLLDNPIKSELVVKLVGTDISGDSVLVSAADRATVFDSDLKPIS
jgi:hypothetical protein